MSKYLYLMLPAILLSFYFNYTGSEIAVFFSACIAIIPLAGIMGEATENLACYTGEKIGGLLNATFGNATELLITIFALKAGLFSVVKASIAGSILGNILLVLGLSILVGGLKNGQQYFDRTHVSNQTSLMFLSVIALIIPAVFFHGSENAIALEEFSLGVAGILIVLYFAGIFFSMRHNQVCEVAEVQGQWSKRKAILMLALSTVFIALESELLVSGIEPVTEALGWSEFFIGIIIIPIIGNAAEHSTAVLMALKNKMDLAFEIAIGSSAQIALLITPILIFLSLLFNRPMNIMFNYYELVAVGLAVLIAQFISLDGESNWLEGALLVGAYLIIGSAFFFI
ncbi:MAG: calcium/proton exchanger [Syntrophomonadaceae bacterium]|nr:calcium/proton exchanger [Syntrophomonadaceae bacterium]MDD3023993.1 calcium/proton exchanger [Syntrophomonadaceae bacterium]